MRCQAQLLSVLDDGREIYQYRLQNGRHSTVCLLNLGAIIQSIEVADRKGKSSDIVLGFEHPQQYLDSPSYFGAVIGRCANRISKGQFYLAGKRYQLACNSAENHIHGGIQGFNKRLWDARILSDSSIEFSLYSADGDQGYPGGLTVWVTYTLTEQNQLQVAYRAQTDQATLINLTQHSYFNLSGNPTQQVLDHHIQINADAFTPVDQQLIPTGEIRAVKGSPFDFNQPKLLADALALSDPQLDICQGFDHNYVLQQDKQTACTNNDSKAQYDAIISHRPSGRQLKVTTDMPGMQFYTSNCLNGSDRGKKTISYHSRSALCLETQHFPNAINQASFPSVVLEAGEDWRSLTTFTFDTIN